MTVFEYGQGKGQKRQYFAEDALSQNLELDISEVQAHTWVLLSAGERSAIMASASVPGNGQPFVPIILAIESDTISIVGQNSSKTGHVLQGHMLAQALRSAVNDPKVGLTLVADRTNEKINYYTIRLGEH